MTDVRLRELELRFQETGLVEDEVTWLQERLRSDTLSPAQIQIASYCGYPAAMMIHQTDSDHHGVYNWVEKIPTLSENGILSLRIAIIVGVYALPYYNEQNPESDLGNNALFAGCNYLYDPSPRNGQVAKQAGLLAQDATEIHISTHGMDSFPDDPKRAISSYAVQAVATSAHIAAYLHETPNKHVWVRTDYPATAAVDTAKAQSIDEKHTCRGTSNISRKELDKYEQIVKQTICDSLIPWVLGYNDPLPSLVATLKATSATD